MNVNEQGAILLMKSAITGEKVTLPEAADIQEVAKILVRKKMVAIFHTGMLNSQIQADGELMESIADMHCVEFINSERQMNAIAAIEQAFEENSIEYMPVKGTLLKKMYPDHALRNMCDADILIREEQYDQIVPVMERLGFRKTGESDHEYIWDSDFLHVELHKRLMPTYNKDYYKYLGEGWDLAKIQKGSRWTMTEEDAFIYNLIHFAKHYRDSEGHCRFINDLWVHMRYCPQLDMAYIREKLRPLGMTAFLDNVLDTINAWYGDGVWNDKVECISNAVFGNKTMSNQQEIANRIRSERKSGRTGKWNALLTKIFPDKDDLKWNYPQLEKVPLVFAWVARWFILMKKRDSFKEKFLKVQDITQEEKAHYRESLEYVGLHFSEK